MNRLGPRVLAASLSVLLLLAVCGVLIIQELRRSDAATAHVMRDYARALLEGQFHEALTRATGEAAAYVQSGNEDFRQEAIDALERAQRAVASLRKLVEEGAAIPGDHSQVVQLEGQESLLRQSQAGIGRAIEAMSAGGGADIRLLLSQVYSSEEPAELLGQATAANHQREQAENERALYEHSQRVRWLVAASATVLAIWFGLLVAYVRRRIVGPLATLSGLAASVADGDLTVTAPVTHSDEIGELQLGFNRMVSELAARRRQRNELVEHLSQARGEAEAASRAKSAFLANVSHEIRTPMNGVVATLDLMHESAPNVEQRDLADLARIAARNLLWMVNDLLDFTRIEAGKLELRSMSFDLRDLVTRTVELHARRGAAKGVAVICDVAADVPARAWGDPVRLGQVLQNLLDNAIKFTAHGAIGVAVSVDRRQPVGAGSEPAADAPFWLLVRVTDSGIGIPESARRRIFRPFEQVQRAGSPSDGGMGIGLSIARELTLLMGGQIGFESAVGKGSTFYFTVGLLPDKACSEPAPAPAEERRLPAGGRVLLAEDNPASREVLARMLERRGLRVTTATNGREALAVASSEPLDLVLMDCKMPDMDGFTAMRSIRSLPGAAARVTIVALTAYGLIGEKQEYLDAGFDDLVSKPYTVEEIEDVLHRWLLRPAGAEDEAPAD